MGQQTKEELREEGNEGVDWSRVQPGQPDD